MKWFQSGKSSFYFCNQFRILVYSNMQKSPPWKLKSPPNLVNHKIAPWGAICPTLNITDVKQKRKIMSDKDELRSFQGNHFSAMCKDH